MTGEGGSKKKWIDKRDKVASPQTYCARRRDNFSEDVAGLMLMWKWTSERAVARGRGGDHPCGE